MSFNTLLTHPGSAHKDDLLACCVLLAKNPVPIQRREPTPEDLADPHTAVVDVGDHHQPERGNFDHHQFPRDTPPTCALSLVLRHYGLYEDAKAFCEWLEPAEWFDCRGPNHTAQWLGVEREVIGKLNSPIDMTLLRRFAASPLHQPGEAVWEMMKLVGEDLVDYLASTRARIDFVSAHSQIWECGPLKFLYLPRVESEIDDPSSGIGHYLREKGLDQEIAGTVYPDRRNTGYGIFRYNDHPALDYTQIENEPDVHFAHKSGFVAKTTATEPDRLRQLAAQGIKAEA
ncbi:MYG1 family protein [Pelagicoccus sp. SDUM812005]|uniref:MYG1 family protein n=1 Tax=Pelagicoccus sp. SDUM812005 TaxID=3041257 RepID=UPI00280D3259|nr:MYG1 family protein [Pelagicoccus sp. SDUM812005]MDQ8181180.1 MYG1 family protein [Pelagicoccus sp. SDUM812005]